MQYTFEIIRIALTVIALVFTAIQIISLTRQVKSNKSWNARDAAFKYCREYSALLKNLTPSFKDGLNLVPLEELNESEEFYSSFFNANSRDGINNYEEANRLLQYFESLSIGILCDYFDEEIVRRTMNRTFTVTYKNLWPYILLRREDTGVEICTHFKRVAEAWIENPMNYPFRSAPSLRKKIHKHRLGK